jgi:hypothetical protein
MRQDDSDALRIRVNNMIVVYREPQRRSNVPPDGQLAMPWRAGGDDMGLSCVSTCLLSGHVVDLYFFEISAGIGADCLDVVSRGTKLLIKGVKCRDELGVSRPALSETGPKKLVQEPGRIPAPPQRATCGELAETH